MIAVYREYHRRDTPDKHPDEKSLTPASVVLGRIAEADSQHHGKRFAGRLDPSSLHCRVLEEAGILVEGKLQASTSHKAHDQDPYADFRRIFRDADSPIGSSPEEEEDEELEIYGPRFGEADKATAMARKSPPTISSVTRKALGIAVSRASCIVSTCVSAGASLIAHNFRPKAVFIDEAGTARVAEFCNAVIRALELKQLAIACLVGDVQQFRSIVGTKLHKPAVLDQVNPMADQLQASLMAQLSAENYPVIMLEEQHRMVAGLKDFSNAQFYHGCLRDGPGTALAEREIAGRALQYLATEMDQAFLVPSVFVHVSGDVTTTAGFESRANPYNLIATLDVASQMILSRVCTAKEITILTPYNGQLRAYANAIDKLDTLQGLTARTIDSFQGAEQHIVIVDLVIARAWQGSTSFIQDHRRLNVALTRGRDCTIVVGDKDCLENIEKKDHKQQ